jgi:hemoglobin
MDALDRLNWRGIIRLDDMNKRVFLILLGIVLSVSARAEDYGEEVARPLVRTPLFDRLGGMPAISAVVDETLRRAGQDGRIKLRFVNANMARLRVELIEQICALSGGPCRYRGIDMKTAHRGMGITSAEFDALVEDLRQALALFKVPAGEQAELVALLAPTKPDIVEAVPGGPMAHASVKAAVLPVTPAVLPQSPVTERAEGLREAAGLLDRAELERKKGNRSLADQLFSFAELIVGADTLASLASIFRDGAPPRITTAPALVALNAQPQPPAAGNSDEEEPPPAPPATGSLAGMVENGGAAFEGFAIVTLEPATGRFHQRAPRHRVVEQRNRQFAPHVLVVPVGSTVSFPNFDGVYHNVFSRSEVKSFDLGLYKAGQEREITFDKEGIVRIGCNLHANMSAVVAVVSAPYYAVTDARGHFAFRSLKPGAYRLRAYSEGRDEPTVQVIRIAPERNSVTVALSAASSSGPLADKFGVPRVQKLPR